MFKTEAQEELRGGDGGQLLDGSAFTHLYTQGFELALEHGAGFRHRGGDLGVEIFDAVGVDHPFSNINLTDNIVQFETQRYSANPLVVQGPGAGPEVTAAGVFADLLRLANYLSTGEGYV